MGDRPLGLALCGARAARDRMRSKAFTAHTMNRPWLAHYPEGVPHDIDPEQYRSLAALLEESLRKNAKHPLAVCMERWMCYGELDE